MAPFTSGGMAVGWAKRRPSGSQGTSIQRLAGEVVGSGPIETLPYRQTIYGMDVGRDAGPTVSGRYQGPFPFAGSLH